jgi:hypothetical protein
VNVPPATTPKISLSFHMGTFWVVVDVPLVTVCDHGGAAVYSWRRPIATEAEPAQTKLADA